MRKLTPEEAAALAAAGQAAPAAPAQEPAHRRPEDQTQVPEEGDPFASLDSVEVQSEVKIEVPTIQGISFVTDDELKASGAVMGNHEENVWVAQGQRTILSVGEGQGHVGDAFTVFRVRRALHHPVTGAPLGYFVQVLGKAEITQLYPETSWARVIEAWAEIQPGDRVIPYVEEPRSITEVRSGEDVKGSIVAFQPYRQRVGDTDFVIIDAGTKQGMVPGRRLQAYRPAKEVSDPLTHNPLMVPDDVIGDLFVVKAGDATSVALVMKAERDIHVGRLRSEQRTSPPRQLLARGPSALPRPRALWIICVAAAIASPMNSAPPSPAVERGLARAVGAVEPASRGAPQLVGLLGVLEVRPVVRELQERAELALLRLQAPDLRDGVVGRADHGAAVLDHAVDGRRSAPGCRAGRADAAEIGCHFSRPNFTFSNACSRVSAMCTGPTRRSLRGPSCAPFSAATSLAIFQLMPSAS